MDVAAKNTNIPLAGHWLPEDTFNSPLDGSFPLFRQLQKLQPEFLEYEQLAKMYKAQPPKSRRQKRTRLPEPSHCRNPLQTACLCHCAVWRYVYTWHMWPINYKRKRSEHSTPQPPGIYMLYVEAPMAKFTESTQLVWYSKRPHAAPIPPNHHPHRDPHTQTDIRTLYKSRISNFKLSQNGREV